LCERRYDEVYLIAATQGGVADNAARPLAYLEDNLRIAASVIRAAADAGVPRLIFAASVLLYGDAAVPPFKEEDLCKGAYPSEQSGYAFAKEAGVRLCEAYARERGLRYSAAILTNMFGAGSTFDPMRATLAPSLIRRAVEARLSGASELVVWGTGRASRDILPATVAADALIHVARTQKDTRPINVAAGHEYTVREIAAAAARAARFNGAIVFDPSKPEGVLSRPVDISRLRALGFEPKFDLNEEMLALAQRYEASLGC
jgi:GDP-L-fucose synthase